MATGNDAEAMPGSRRCLNGLNGVLTLTFLALAACANEPSEADLRVAFESSVAKSQAMASAMAGSRDVAGVGNWMQAELHGLRKLGCARAKGAGGFVCDVELDMTVPFVGRTRHVGTVRMVKGTEGWQALVD